MFVSTDPLSKAIAQASRANVNPITILVATLDGREQKVSVFKEKLYALDDQGSRRERIFFHSANIVSAKLVS